MVTFYEELKPHIQTSKLFNVIVFAMLSVTITTIVVALLCFKTTTNDQCIGIYIFAFLSVIYVCIVLCIYLKYWCCETIPKPEPLPEPEPINVLIDNPMRSPKKKKSRSKSPE
jgi:hypothetical protein